MKVLDVSPFQDGLRRNIAMLDRLGNEMELVHKSIEGLVAMEDVLKGEGGNAIRAFYADCHLPFYQFFTMFQGRFIAVLKQMVAALDTLEPDPSGYIQQHFLESNIEQGLRHIAQLTGSLTDEANSIMNQVADIVSLPHLDDSEVQSGVRDATIKRDDTVTQLYEFDATQTTALTPVAQDLLTMETWISDIESMFQEGLTDVHFESNQWNVLTFRSEIRTNLFPKVYLNPSDLWIEKQEQLIGTMITAATFQTLEGKKVTTIEENLDENVKYHMYENGLLIKEYVVDQKVHYEVVSKVEYKEENIQADKTKGSKVLDFIQTGLDIVGLVPVIGEPVDLINGVIYGARGDALNAGLSMASAIPFAGWAGTGLKLTGKATDLNQVSKVVRTEKMESIYSPIYQDVVNGPLGKTQNQLDFLSNTPYQLGTPNAFTFNTPFGRTDIPTSIKSGDVKVEVKNVDVGAKGADNNTLLKLEDFTKEILETKPMNSPLPKKWYDKGGKTSIDSDGTWTYTNKSGVSVRYPDGFPDFTPFMHPNVKPVKIEIQSPKNNPKDFENANKDAKLTKDTDPPIIDIRRPPEGYTWHHHQDGKTMMLVDEDIHREFRHIGGQSKVNGKNK